MKVLKNSLHTTSSYFSLKEMLRAIGTKISAQFFLIARLRDVVSGSSKSNEPFALNPA